MALAPGTHFGPYEITAPLGAGGMGEVYRAELAGALDFDLHPDGQRFAVLKAPPAGEAAPVNKVTFILNFFNELRRKVPTGKN